MCARTPAVTHVTATRASFLRVNSRDKGSWFVTVVHPPNFRFVLSLSLSRVFTDKKRLACTGAFRSRGRAIRRSYVQMTRILNASTPRIKTGCVHNGEHGFPGTRRLLGFFAMRISLAVYRRHAAQREEEEEEEKEEEGGGVVSVGDRKEEERKDRGEYSATVVDDCQSIRESASREYRGWLPSLLDEQLYLSSTS